MVFFFFFNLAVMCEDQHRFSVMLIRRNLKLFICSTSAPVMQTKLCVFATFFSKIIIDLLVLLTFSSRFSPCMNLFVMCLINGGVIYICQNSSLSGTSDPDKSKFQVPCLECLNVLLKVLIFGTSVNTMQCILLHDNVLLQ